MVREHLAADRPFLGICVGLQLLLEASEEAPGEPGLGVLPGTVKRFPKGASVPQMGWNELHKVGDPPLLDGVEDGAFAYFAHSFYADFATADVGAVTHYGGVSFLSAVSLGRLHATQFHPEKSQHVGLAILENFGRLAREPVTR